jgi:ureidoacrylate peracid hydrolase
MQLNAAKSALLVIDMQVFFLAEHSPSFTCGGVAIIPKVKRLVDAFRKAKRPVIFSRHVHHPDDLDSGIMGWWWKGKCLEGSPESEVHPELAPLPGEKVVFKHRYSAFYNTDLETVLRVLKVEDLVTRRDDQYVLRVDRRDAYFRDYRCSSRRRTGSINEEMQLASLMNLALGCFVTTSEAIATQLSG